VKYGESNPVPIATERCDFVALFIKAVKKEMQLPEPPQNITLHVSEDSDALNPRWSLRNVIQDYGVNQESTLIVKTIQPQGNLSYVSIWLNLQAYLWLRQSHRHLLHPKDLVLK
jgi:hypothetical protein